MKWYNCRAKCPIVRGDSDRCCGEVILYGNTCPKHGNVSQALARLAFGLCTTEERHALDCETRAAAEAEHQALDEFIVDLRNE